MNSCNCTTKISSTPTEKYIKRQWKHDLALGGVFSEEYTTTRVQQSLFRGASATI
jgi:hypothetical protein